MQIGYKEIQVKKRKFWELPQQSNALSKTPQKNSIFRTPTHSKSSNRIFFTKIEDHKLRF